MTGRGGDGGQAGDDFAGQRWQPPGQGTPFSQDGYFPGQGWQNGPGMAGGGRITAGGFSLPSPGQQDDGYPGEARPRLRINWNGTDTSTGSGTGPPPPEMTLSQRLSESLRAWYWDRWYAFEDFLVELIRGPGH